MYLHLGQDIVVPFRDIIGIFDIENTSVSRLTKDYLTECQKRCQVISVSEELPRSFIVCAREGVRVVYLSQISSATLLKRTELTQNELLNNV